MRSDLLLYQDMPEYDSWVKLMLGGLLAITFLPGIVFIFIDTGTALAMFAVTLFDSLLFAAILPRQFQVFEDRLRIDLGGPFAMNVPLSEIKEVRTVSASHTFLYWGIRLATSTSFVVEIVRTRGLDIVVSPSHGDIFIEELNRARMAVEKSD